MTLDHVSVGVTDIDRSKEFYDAALATLGMAPVMPVHANGHLAALGYGKPDHASFWIGPPIDGRPARMGNGVHIALRAEKRAHVDGFFRAALEHGGIDDGKPGLRPDYDPDYYAAFVRDPDGNKIEAVCHTRE